MSEEPDQATLVHLTTINRALKDENKEFRSHKIANKQLLGDIQEMVEAYENMLWRLEDAYQRNPQWQKYSRSRRQTIPGLRHENDEQQKEHRLILKNMDKEIKKRDRKLATRDKRLEKFRQTLKELRKEVKAGQRKIEQLEKEVMPLSFLRERVRHLEKELGKSDNAEALTNLKHLLQSYIEELKEVHFNRQFTQK